MAMRFVARRGSGSDDEDGELVTEGALAANPFRSAIPQSHTYSMRRQYNPGRACRGVLPPAAGRAKL